MGVRGGWLGGGAEAGVQALQVEEAGFLGGKWRSDTGS